ncbi:MAG: hypothetical protein IT427_19970 [Pirellulales bacterium]|nr:hypothetical protein [Pirellulales bacterium]
MNNSLSGIRLALLLLAFVADTASKNTLAAIDTDGRSCSIDLSAAQVMAPDGLNRQERKAVQMFVDEVAARTRLHLRVSNAWPVDKATPVIVIGPFNALRKLADYGQSGLDSNAQIPPAEGFRIHTKKTEGGSSAVVVAGNDSRGVLFGVGKLLRSLSMSRDRLVLREPLNITTAPAMPIRGHQLGYRPKTNSYDAWDLPQWEQYYRDLAVFGCNSVELIPPRTDDDDDSPHFPRPPLEMMIGMSQLADDYGLDVWIWHPAMELKYDTPEKIRASVKEWGDVLSKLPRVNALFVPTGDPGDASPGEYVALLAAQSEQLTQLHPSAKIWVSMQSFTQPQFDEMLQLFKREPAWLAGIVFGPQNRVPIAKLREILPPRLPIRAYPDITHSIRCQYPVPNWDLAFPLTEGREVINPRPLDETTIFLSCKDYIRGVISYSEGCNDDVNKMIWSALCWDPAARPIDTLHDYSRYFIGDQYTDDFAQGLLALERNWRGPLLKNDGVDETRRQFQAMERSADPPTKRNWRFQQTLYRATYDAYIRSRLIDETAQEHDALDVLARAHHLGADKAIRKATAILDQADAPKSSDALRARVAELAEGLFQSIGMQLSVDRYQAIEVGRGANFDEIDVPLNNRVWLKNRFAGLAKLDEAARLRGIGEIVHWTDPGPGGFYDDLGDPLNQPHLVASDMYAKDPSYHETPTIGFNSQLAWRRSWCNHVDGHYSTPVVMHYDGLDASGSYKLRVVYAGDNTGAKVRLVALSLSGGREIDIHPPQPKPQPVRPVEFAIPAAATSGGELTLEWRSNPERGGAGRGCQIAEVWLIKTQK